MICKSCQKEIPEDSLYCPFCGNQVAELPQNENRMNSNKNPRNNETSTAIIADRIIKEFDKEVFSSSSDEERREYIKKYTEEIVSVSKMQIKEEQKKKNIKRLKISMVVLISVVLLSSVSAISFFSGKNHSLEKMYAITNFSKTIHSASCETIKTTSTKYKYYFYPDFRKNNDLSYLSHLENIGFHYCDKCFD